MFFYTKDTVSLFSRYGSFDTTHTPDIPHANYSSRRVILLTGTTYVGHRLGPVGAHMCEIMPCYGMWLVLHTTAYHVDYTQEG